MGVVVVVVEGARGKSLLDGKLARLTVSLEVIYERIWGVRNGVYSVHRPYSVRGVRWRVPNGFPSRTT